MHMMTAYHQACIVSCLKLIANCDEWEEARHKARESDKQASSTHTRRNSAHLDVQRAYFCVAWHGLREDPRCTPIWCLADTDTAHDKARLGCMYEATSTSTGMGCPF